jgi:5'-deoxynucleotidase YfbR-like HD superfamily hydrolase
MNIVDKALIYRAGFSVERLHCRPKITEYNNGFHSANAALIAMDLCLANHVPYYSVIHYMLLHDLHESYTGDVPGNVKIDHEGLHSEFLKIERRWNEMFLPDSPDLSTEEKVICKCADLIELGLFYRDEFNLGNRTLKPVKLNVLNYLEHYKDIIGVSEFIQYITHGEI